MPKAAISEGEYNTLDLAVTAGIFDKLAEAGMVEATAFDHALMGPALTMGLRGLRVDERRKARALADTEAEARKWWQALDGSGLKRGKSIAPAAQALARVLYREQGAPVQFNRDGAPTCDRDALVKLVDNPKTPDRAAEIAAAALELRRLEEDRKVLVKSLGPDGRMHTSFGVAATVTGRWSSSRDHFAEGANLHALSHRVHEIFIPDPGMMFVNFDLKQAESLTVAYLAGSDWYKQAHKSGNVHALVGARIWPEVFAGGKKQAQATPLPWDVDRNYYDLAKRTQHGFNYLLTPAGFARQAKMARADAKEIHLAYQELVPEVFAWHREIAQELKAKHRLRSPMGRERVFFGRMWEASTIKEAVAFVPQSTVSDINKVILWRLWSRFDPGRLQVLLECHDSVLFQCREADMDTVREAFQLTAVEVPIRGDTMVIEAEAAIGANWGNQSNSNPGGLHAIELH